MVRVNRPLPPPAWALSRLQLWISCHESAVKSTRSSHSLNLGTGLLGWAAGMQADLLYRTSADSPEKWLWRESVKGWGDSCGIVNWGNPAHCCSQVHHVTIAAVGRHISGLCAKLWNVHCVWISLSWKVLSIWVNLSLQRPKCCLSTWLKCRMDFFFLTRASEKTFFFIKRVVCFSHFQTQNGSSVSGLGALRSSSFGRWY